MFLQRAEQTPATPRTSTGRPGCRVSYRWSWRSSIQQLSLSAEDGCEEKSGQSVHPPGGARSGSRARRVLGDWSPPSRTLHTPRVKEAGENTTSPGKSLTVAARPHWIIVRLFFSSSSSSSAAAAAAAPAANMTAAAPAADGQPGEALAVTA